MDEYGAPGTVARSRQVLAEDSLDQPARGILDGQGNPATLRVVLLTMIEEFAHHNDHADRICEAIPGGIA